MAEFDQLSGLNAYEILGVPPTASRTEITAAWKERIAAQHPDRGGSPRLAQLTNDAKAVLTTRREAYDRHLLDRAQPEELVDPWADATPGWQPLAATRSPTPTVPRPDRQGHRTAPLAPPSSTGWPRGRLVLVLGAVAAVGLLIWGAVAVFGLRGARDTAEPAVLKQGTVAVRRGTDVTLDTPGRSFRPASENAVTFSGTRRGLSFPAATRVAALPAAAQASWASCQALGYPEPAKRSYRWAKLPVGTRLCTSSASFHTSLITVTKQNRASLRLQITTWER